jgi:hypothetical protein
MVQQLPAFQPQLDIVLLNYRLRIVLYWMMISIYMYQTQEICVFRRLFVTKKYKTLSIDTFVLLRIFQACFLSFDSKINLIDLEIHLQKIEACTC